MSKQKSPPPLSGLASSQARQAAHAQLASTFTSSVPILGEARLSVQRAGTFVARRKDPPTTALRLRREARARVAEAIEDSGIRRRYLAEQRAMDRTIDGFWRRFHAKARRLRSERPQRAKHKARRPAGSARLPSYSGPVIDRLGRRGVYMDVRYYGARRARVGVGRRMVFYITREDGVEHDGAGAIILSNVGVDLDEQAAAFDLVETLNRAAQGNAKVVFSMIVNLPHDVSPEARREILERFCEEAFTLHDLPFVAAVHEPSAEGDQRNTHGHILFALRPLRRTGPSEWEAGRALLSEFDCPERFGYWRALFAQEMTEVVNEQGKNRIYTHLSNADRGLKNKPLIPLGPARTAIVRRGGDLPDNERNRAEIALSEELLAEDRAARRLDRAQERIDGLRTLGDAMIGATPRPRSLAQNAPVSVVALPDRAALADTAAASMPPSIAVVLPHAVTRQSRARIDGPALVKRPMHSEPLAGVVVAESAADAHRHLSQAVAGPRHIPAPAIDGRVLARGIPRGDVRSEDVFSVDQLPRMALDQSVRDQKAVPELTFEMPATLPSMASAPSAAHPMVAVGSPPRSRPDAPVYYFSALFDAVVDEPPVRKNLQPPSLKSPLALPIAQIDRLIETFRRLRDRAAAAKATRERQGKRRRPGIAPWGVGGDGIGG